MKLPDQVLIDASVVVKSVVDEPGGAEAVLLLDRQLAAILDIAILLLF